MTKRGWGGGSGDPTFFLHNFDLGVQLSLYARFHLPRLTITWLKVCVLFFYFFYNNYSVLAQLGFSLAWLELGWAVTTIVIFLLQLKN